MMSPTASGELVVNESLSSDSDPTVNELLVDTDKVCPETAVTEHVVEESTGSLVDVEVVTVITLAVEVVGGDLMLVNENEKELPAEMGAEKIELAETEVPTMSQVMGEVKDPVTLVHAVVSAIIGG